MKANHIELKLTRISRIVFRMLRTRGIIKKAKDPALTIALAPNILLRKLKKTLLHKDVKIVDVLAFPDAIDFPHPESKTEPLGEVLLNEDIARKDFSRAVLLLIHGILHLLGYRHEAKRDIIVMEKLEKEILEKLKPQSYYDYVKVCIRTGYRN